MSQTETPVILAWINAHEDGTPEEAEWYLDGTVCGCCGVDFGEE